MERVIGLWRRLLCFFRRRQLSVELEEEMRFHIDMLTDRYRADGMPSDEAAYAVRRSFGNTTLLREMSREAWVWRAAETLWQDVKHALRLLARAPGSTAAAVLTLALGIGANCVMFSVFDAALLRPFPFRDTGRLVFVWTGFERERRVMSSLPDYLDWRATNNVFEDMGARLPMSFTLTGPYPEKLVGQRATASFFTTLGAQPQLGRLFVPEEEHDGHDHVALISDSLWKTRFQANPRIVGSSILLGRNNDPPEPHTIAGVLPPGMRSAFPKYTDIWVPLNLDGEEAHQRRSGILEVIGRLKPGVTTRQATAAMTSLQASLAAEHPDSNRDARGVYLADFHQYLTDSGRSVLPSLMGAVAFVLLIACANVANLMLARTTDRAHEMAIRSALGAGRTRLIRQLMTESLLTSLAGGVAGALLAAWAVRAVRVLVPVEIARSGEVAIDIRVLLFTFALTMLTGLVFGILPALRGSRRPPLAREQGVLRRALVVAEIAVGMVLLTGAALMLNSFVRLLRVDLGFDRHDVLVVRTSLPWKQYKANAQARYSAIDDVLTRVRSLPGVRYAAISDFRPLGNSRNTLLRKQSAPDVTLPVCSETVTEDYFLAMGIRQIRGRTFSYRDDSRAPLVALVNETAARRYWPGEQPIGKLISIGYGKDLKFREIVGMVADVRSKSVDRPPEPAIYVPQAQDPSLLLDLIVRTEAGVLPIALAPSVRGALAAVDLIPAAEDVKTMETVVSERLARPRFLTALLGAFGIIALALTATGIFGVMAYMVRLRRREIGIRIAVGAEGSDVLALVLGGAARLIAAGLAIGLPASIALSRALRSMLYEVRPADPHTMFAVLMLLALVALSAAWWPARRATQVDPIAVLRQE